jgi:hypothetical protein
MKTAQLGYLRAVSSEVSPYRGLFTLKLTYYDRRDRQQKTLLL